MGDRGTEAGQAGDHGAGQQHAIEGLLLKLSTQLRHGQQADADEQQRGQQQPQHVALQRAILEAVHAALGKLDEALHVGLEHQQGIAGAELALEGIEVVAQGIDGDAARQRDTAHQQRQIEAVPDGETEVRYRPGQHAGGGTDQQVLDHQRRQNTDQQTDQHQHLDGQLHVARRLMRGLGQILRLAIEEDVVDEAQ